MCYNFRLKIEKLSGNPVNSHCECPAGKGPNATCKHIAAVLLMLESFSQTGEKHVKNSCTQDLQTFHKPSHVTTVRDYSNFFIMLFFLVMNMIKVHLLNEQYICNKIVNMLGMHKLHCPCDAVF